MANAIWDGQPTYVTWGTATVNSTSFNIMRGSGAITFILPNFATSSAAALHVLDPIDKTTWRALFVFDPADSSQSAFSIAEDQATIVPAGVLGTGTYRFVTANAQTGLTATIIIDTGR